MPRFENNHVRGNCIPCFNSIETNLVYTAYNEIENKKESGLSSWGAWFGKKIAGESYVNNIANDKVRKARGKAEKIIPGIINKILFRILMILIICGGLGAGLFGVIYYVLDERKEPIIMVIVISVVAFISIIGLTKTMITSTVDDIKKQIEKAAS